MRHRPGACITALNGALVMRERILGNPPADGNTASSERHLSKLQIMFLTCIKRSAIALFLRGWMPARAVRWLFAALPLRSL